jgi:hypothetical protein
VSPPPFDSLNLTAGTGDDVERVAENRRLACDSLRLDAERLTWNRQVHSTTVRSADGERGTAADGIVGREPGQPLLAMSADCLPIAVVTTGDRRALCVLHAGWRGLAAGIVAAGVESVGGGPTAAVIGPGIGPCCYEIGPEVAALFDADLTLDGKLDLWRAAERALVAAGVGRVERVDLCTQCNEQLFFSHRRSGRERGAQGVIGAVA